MECRGTQVKIKSAVKQEIFITDVNICVAALKKMVQEMRQHAAVDKDLLLAQPTAR